MGARAATYYVLFHDHTEGLALFGRAKREGADVRIAPAPREATACCGMSLLVADDSIDAVRRLIDGGECSCDRIVRLGNRIDPRRDTYC